MRLLPMLIPLVIVIQVAMPGTLGTFQAILKPSYVIQEQSREAGTGSGRIADLGPSLERVVARRPSSGRASEPAWSPPSSVRATWAPAARSDLGAQILDNQWLGTLLEIGAVGVLGLLWLFCRAIRRLAAEARSDPGPDGWLATAPGGGAGGVRRRDAHLRRLRLHPGHVPRLRHARLHGRRSQRADDAGA